MILFVLISSFFINSISFADDEVFSIFAMDCEDEVVLLDYKELYSLESSFKYDLSGNTEREIFDSYLQRFKKFDHGRSLVFNRWFEKIKTKTRFLRNVHLGQPDDFFNFPNWNNCKMKVLAKGQDINDEGMTLTINEDLWKRMNLQSKVGLYFNYFLNVDHILHRYNEDTERTRFFNALIASNQFEKIPYKEYPKMYEELLDFNSVSFYGLNFRVESFSGGRNGRDYSIRFNEEGKLILGKNYVFGYTFDEESNTVRFQNVPSFQGWIYGLMTFKYLPEQDQKIESFKLNKTAGCVGPYKIPYQAYIELTYFLKNDKLYLKSIDSKLEFNNKVYNGIIQKNGKFILGPQLEGEQEAKVKVEQCHEL
jgi:hypothetical protein